MLEIKKASLKDIEKIQSLRRKLLKYQHSVNPIKSISDKKLVSSDKLVEIYLKRDYSIMYLAFLDKKAIGFIHGTIDPKSSQQIRAYIQDLFIEEEFRSQGIGSKLLTKLELFFKNKNVVWGLTTDNTLKNKKTINFYLNRGYKIIKEENNVAYFIKML